MNEKQVREATRLAALEYFVIHVAKVAYVAAGLSPETMRRAHANILAGLDQETFEGTDPATSDLLAGEVRDEVARLLRDLELSIAQILQR